MHIERHFLILAAALWTVSAFADIPSDPAQGQPLAVGMQAPTFRVQTKDGVVRTFSPQSYQKPTVVIFYRGGWCPYCNMQLNDLRLVEPKLRQSGFEIVFLSTDRPAILYSSLKSEHIDYTLLSDSRLEAAKAFHIAQETAEHLKWGQSGNDDRYEGPRPAGPLRFFESAHLADHLNGELYPVPDCR